MKKAKRIIALLLTLLMVASGANITAYALYSPYDTPSISATEKYVFNAQQGASYVLDLLDNILAEANLNMTWDDLGAGVVSDLGIAKCDSLDFRSVDRAVSTIIDLIDTVNDNGLYGAIIKGVAGDIESLNKAPLQKGKSRPSGGYSDFAILEMVVEFLYNNRGPLRQLVGGVFDLGLLDGVLPAMLKSLGPFLKNTIYTALIDDTYTCTDDLFVSDTVEYITARDASGNPTASTTVTIDSLDDMVQVLVNWLLVYGTGETAENGGRSIVGENFEAIFPSLSDTARYPGGADISTQSVYGLVNNIINCALDNLVVPLVSDLLIGAFDIETTEEYPLGNPSELTTNTTLLLVVNLIETLAVSNGATPPDYDTYPNTDTPIGKIDAVLTWFFADGGMSTFLLFDESGFHVQDNFTSLLGDLGRLAVNLLPGLGLFDAMADSYSAEDLNECYYCEDPATTTTVVSVNDASQTATKTFVTLETYDEIGDATHATNNDVDKQYVVYTNDDGETYYYLGTTTPIDTSLFTVKFIRDNYLITTSQVFAYILKLALNTFVEGCYFPEEAQSIASIGAYALAALTAEILPGMNFIEQLDANYPSLCGEDGLYRSAKDGSVVTPLPFEAEKTGTYNIGTSSTGTKTYLVPQAALKIASCLGAFYLNGILDATFTLDTTPELFVGELATWGAERYLPILTGTRNGNNYTGGTYSAAFTAYRSTGNTYKLLDDTLFTLIPTSWLADGIDGSFDLVYGWLLSSVMDLDFQNLLSILSVNTDSNAELNEDLVTVLIRVVDRVLSLVLNGHPVLPDYNRDGMSAIYTNNTSFTTLDQIINTSGENAGLPSLVYYLLENLARGRMAEGNMTGSTVTKILTTVLPLLLSAEYKKPYRPSSIGSNPNIGIEDLEGYIESINHQNTVYDAETDTYTPIRMFDVAATKNYSTDAAYVVNSLLYPDNDGGRDVFSGFSRAQYIAANSVETAGYYGSGYVCYGPEDYTATLYRYNNGNDAVSDAASYASNYRQYATETLPSYYETWQRYFINSRLYQAGLYDQNADGVIDANDAAPGVPGVPYPYATTSTQAITLYNEKHVAFNTTGNIYNATNYEVLALAEAAAADATTRVTLGSEDTNAVVRLALGLAPSAFTGDDLSVLTSAQIATLTSSLSSIGYAYDATTQTITRPRFAYFTSSTVTGLGVDAIPGYSKPTTPDPETNDSKLDDGLYESYCTYVQEIMAQKQGLLDAYDLINYRVELAEAAGSRNTDCDITQLQWALNKYSAEYYSGVPNAVYGRNVKTPNYVNGVPNYTKNYTATSYANFQEAYDFAYDLVAAASASVTDNIPQSLVSQARAALMDAYNALVEFTGAADIVALLEYIGVANEIIDSSTYTDAIYGYTEESRAVFEDWLSDAEDILALAQAGTYDCEYQSLINSTASQLNAATNALAFLTAADIIPTVVGGEELCKVWTTVPTGRIVGMIYGLTEGTSIADESIFSVIGLRENTAVDDRIETAQTTAGIGTGASVRGYRGGSEVFRYYAVLYGDLNGDARIDGSDKTKVQYCILTGTLSTGLTEQQREAADVNHDGEIDSIDTDLIQSRVEQPANMNVITQNVASRDIV